MSSMSMLRQRRMESSGIDDALLQSCAVTCRQHQWLYPMDGSHDVLEIDR